MSKAEGDTVFQGGNLKQVIRDLLDQIKALYASDQIPWVIGYSGGKDSTAVAQLVWMALSEMPENERLKPVHVISTDTLVENPVVSMWVSNSLKCMENAATKAGLPITAHMLMPEVADTFWVNLIGKGYPAPRHKFRWCTERLKIRPADSFVKKVVKDEGEAILVLGTRRAESSARAAAMRKRAEARTRDLLNPSETLQNAFVYSPIEDWSNDDVWTFLMQYANPWGYNNKDLLTMYSGASADGECPLVVDTSTPSCGNSRFGCWVCTMVSQDKSMAAMIRNDTEKEWMNPLLKLRDELAANDHDKRDFRRMSGQVQLFNKLDDDGQLRHIPGPYTQKTRAEWLRKLLRVQKIVRNHSLAPDEVRSLELISMDELHEIRRIWVVEKHEIEDLLPDLYKDVTGVEFEKKPLDDRQPFAAGDMELLKDCCEGNELHFELVRELLDTERKLQNQTRRSKLTESLEKAFRRGFYENTQDAAARASRKKDMKEAVESVGGDQELSLIESAISSLNTVHHEAGGYKE